MTRATTAAAVESTRRSPISEAKTSSGRSPLANQRIAVPLSPNSDSETPIRRKTVRTVKRP